MNASGALADPKERKREAFCSRWRASRSSRHAEQVALRAFYQALHAWDEPLNAYNGASHA
jgi:hypothetical protein